MARFDVAGTAPQDAPTIKQEGVLPTAAALVGVPLRAAAVPGVILGLCVVIVAVVVIVFAGLAAEPGAWLVAGAGALVVCLGVTLKLWPERYREVLPAIYKREMQTGQDLDGDGVIGPPPHPPVWTNNKPPAEDAPLRERAKMRLFVQALYDAGTSYNALRGAGFNSDADIRLRLVELQQGGVLKLVKRGQRDTVELLLDRTAALERLDRAKFMDDAR